MENTKVNTTAAPIRYSNISLYFWFLILKAHLAKLQNCAGEYGSTQVWFWCTFTFMICFAFCSIGLTLKQRVLCADITAAYKSGDPYKQNLWTDSRCQREQQWDEGKFFYYKRCAAIAVLSTGQWRIRQWQKMSKKRRKIQNPNPRYLKDYFRLPHDGKALGGSSRNLSKTEEKKSNP